MQLHSVERSRATCAEEYVQLPHAPETITVRIPCKDQKPVAAEHEDGQAPERPVDVVLIDAYFVPDIDMSHTPSVKRTRLQRGMNAAEARTHSQPNDGLSAVLALELGGCDGETGVLLIRVVRPA